MKANIKIEGKNNVIPGSVEWLKNIINESRFRFASTIEGEPCIVWDFLRKENEKTIVKKSKVVVFLDADLSDTQGYRLYNNCCLIRTHGNDYHESALFGYLTDNAAIYCNRLLKSLADKLVERLEADKQELTIEVTVK